MNEPTTDKTEKPFELHRGDCLTVLRTIADNSIDSIVTDPPYGISFMGKRWDYDVPSIEVWAECLRVLKPGAYLLSFGGTRTYHRLATRIEDAGFILHPLIGWIFGQGFPKATRVQLENMDGWRYGLQSLKPAIEPIAMAQKPFSEKTGAANIARWGVGAINIDACRIQAEPMQPNTGAGGLPRRSEGEQRGGGVLTQPHALGRWPANLIHDGSDEVLAGFPDEAGALAPVKGTEPTANGFSGAVSFKGLIGRIPGQFHGDSGSAARFFYCAKASRTDRNEGTEALPQIAGGMVSNTSDQHITRRDEGYEAKPQGNHHPTVKPTDLMAYLQRLVTPPGGTTVDIYTGSGSSGKAAMREGFRFIGIERDEDENGQSLGYIEIAEARIELEWRRALERAEEVTASSAQLDIFNDAPLEAEQAEQQEGAA